MNRLILNVTIVSGIGLFAGGPTLLRGAMASWSIWANYGAWIHRFSNS